MSLEQFMPYTHRVLIPDVELKDVHRLERKLVEMELLHGQTSPCWLWTGDISPNGYGNIGYKNTPIRVHRLAYRIAKGPLTLGRIIAHKCNIQTIDGMSLPDYRHCCQPEHLVETTNAKNTNSIGHFSKYLNEQQIIEIRHLYATGKYTQMQLAEIFNSSASRISEIVNHKTYQNVK